MTLTAPDVAAINAANATLKAARAQERAAEAEEEAARHAAETLLTIKGETGAQGIQGLTGPEGPSGLSIKGEPGTNGTNGAQGATGPRGATGAAGKDGVGPDEKVKLSKKDPVAGFLTDKLKAGLNVQFRQEKSPDGDSLVIDATGGGGGGGGASTPAGINVYDDGVAVGFGDKVSYDGGDPVTVSGGIIHVPVGSGSGPSSDDQTAAEVPFTPAGTIAASNTQAAVEEVATDAASALSSHAADTTAVHGIADTSALVLTGDARLSDSRPPNGGAGGVLSGSYPNPGFAVDMATQGELDAHTGASVMDGDAAGGDLSGTYPNPSVVDDSHNHTSATLPAGSAQDIEQVLTEGGDPNGVPFTGAVEIAPTDNTTDTLFTVTAPAGWYDNGGGGYAHIVSEEGTLVYEFDAYGDDGPEILIRAPEVSNQFRARLGVDSFQLDDGLFDLLGGMVGSTGGWLFRGPLDRPVDGANTLVARLAGVRASVVLDFGGGVTLSLRAVPTADNALTIALVDPGAPNQALSVSGVYPDVVVSLATDGGGAITSTNEEVADAITASVDAAVLMTAHADNSGVVTAVAPTTLTGGLPVLDTFVVGPTGNVGFFDKAPTPAVQQTIDAANATPQQIAEGLIAYGVFRQEP